MKVQLTNGVSWGKKYVVTADDVTATKVEFEFIGVTGNEPSYDLAVVVQIIRADSVVTSDAKVTVDGAKVTIKDGSTYTLTEDDVINIIANRTL